MSQPDLKRLQNQIKYQFTDVALLKSALTHRSVGGENNERLEFLGDAILSGLIAIELFERFPKSREGALSRLRSTLVNGDTLSQMAKALDLPEYLRLGVGEVKSGGQYRQSILADALEALIGAIYLDAGLERTRECVLAWYNSCYPDFSSVTPVKDAKSKLQEWLQANKMPLPIYIATASGEAHAQTFHVVVKIDEMNLEAKGESTSRRRAEQIAAEKLLEKIHG